MKKFFVCALAALSLTACVNEDGLLSESKGYINLNVNTEESVNVTRGTVPSTATDWYVKVNSDAAITVAELASKAYTASTENTLTAYNYVDMAAALGANDGRGAAYWTGTSSQFAIEAGKSANVTVNCGAAKNAAFAVEFDKSFTDIVKADYSVTVTSNERAIVYDKSNATDGYFEPTTDNIKASYSISATISATEKPINVTKNNIVLAAGTKTTLTIKANTNGTISLTINYNEMTDADAQDITIDAATGEEVPETPVTE